ncbi:MAG: hypothetical protein QMD46_07040 [Methanomicrobiales archaeon]|nr:hypothetical protein [Methanomicrobiales archaeon]
MDDDLPFYSEATIAVMNEEDLHRAVKVIGIPPRSIPWGQSLPELRRAFSTAQAEKRIQYQRKKEREARRAEREAKKREKEKVQRSFVIAEDRIYLTVMTRAGEFEFACLDDQGQIAFAPSIVVDGKEVFPQSLPMDRGKFVFIVGVPVREVIEQAELRDANALAERVRKHLNRYIDAPETELDLFVFFILFTWFYRKTNTTPYLRFLADTGKGKSRMARVVSDLCFYPITAEGTSTASGIMRFKGLWDGTLKIDESDFRGGIEAEIIKYLNLGFEEGHPYIKTDKTDPKQQEFFDPFCPKVIAMREPFKDNATEGRLLSFTPHETRRKDLPIILPKEYPEEVEALRAEICRFVLHAWPSVEAGRYIDTRDLPIEPRLKQLVTPLSLIVQIFPEAEQKLKNYMQYRQLELRKTRAESWEGALFNHVYNLARGDEDPPEQYQGYKDPGGGVGAVVPGMLTDVFKRSATEITRSLKSIGFETERERRTISLTRKVKSYDGEVREEPREVKKNITKYVVPTKRVWKEIRDRYYYPEGQNGSESRQINLNQAAGDPLDCPEVLRGRAYVTSSE